MINNFFKKKINLASKLTAHSLFTKEMKVTENYSFKLTKKQMHCEYDYIHAKFKLVQFKRPKQQFLFTATGGSMGRTCVCKEKKNINNTMGAVTDGK